MSKKLIEWGIAWSRAEPTPLRVLINVVVAFVLFGFAFCIASIPVMLFVNFVLWLFPGGASQ